MTRPVMVRAEPQDSSNKQQQPQQQEAWNPNNPIPQYKPELTTWQYGKTKDPGLGPYYIVAMFIVPFLLLLIPFLPQGK
eukprot:CAMPEP_0202869564 /NCGR_PEP_ID=MMETSP1391-20130828/12526_1 /ASSEMBLY_ACC=CAM_ASM_000867 /TAXON_ID=1034604 /ORGANISM="Chlamydomonas leiostraca, Strain SAG 11-49" /LENGTH=78 /DNA_ID=CAMNT_0049549899 /DNA_START=162 /DNA_END=398 /DNA_ORIENTATION=-